eukprot:gb/GEZJ01007873.1/.p1 GENE.gb/GEZJ01007873.1/~~gb/GEZJ01007873.1/.p1  ORF type:complete len:131 (-),score=4.14 gb/GEZJ01007873.1/:269-661(-)
MTSKSERMRSIFRIELAHMVTVVLKYNCSEDKFQQLKLIWEELYPRFVRYLGTIASQSYCYTPTTHVILHLPNLLWQCRFLPIPSQFVVERLLGGIGKCVQQTSNLTAHLFHKNFKLFNLMLANEGIVPV